MTDRSTNARSVSLEAFRRYLRLNGWAEAATRRDVASLFTLAIGDDRLELPLPTRRDVEESDRLIADALRTLGQLNDRDISDVVADINAVGFDRIRSIIPDELVRADTINLNVASGFISSAKRLITAAATTELGPSTFFGRVTKDALAYTDRCRFGHTFRGSFGFTIESPLASNNQPSFPGVEETPPFERRVIQRLARGLNHIQSAETHENPDIIAENYQTGFNANMCDALIEMVEKTGDRLRIEIAWSPEWNPSADVVAAPSFLLQPSTLDLVQNAAASLRQVDDAQSQTIVGTVVRLKSEHNPADLIDVSSPREIVVQWISDEFGLLNVRMNLSPTDYIVALEAHRTGRRVSVDGMLERINRSWILSFPSNIQLIHSE